MQDQGLRILVAEDNPINQKVVIALLCSMGHSVDVVENGLQAIRAVCSQPYDVVLMDINMPEMDGVTATKCIRELDGERARIPIIAVTANAMKGDREKFINSGMDDYVPKPIDKMELYQAIASLCDVQLEAGSPIDVEVEKRTTSAEAKEDLAGLLKSLDDLD